MRSGEDNSEHEEHSRHEKTDESLQQPVLVTTGLMELVPAHRDAIYLLERQPENKET